MRSLLGFFFDIVYFLIIVFVFTLWLLVLIFIKLTNNYDYNYEPLYGLKFILIVGFILFIPIMNFLTLLGFEDTFFSKKFSFSFSQILIFEN